METREKIEFIRQKAIEANPSIKDWEFGAIVMFGLKKRRIVDFLGVGEDGKRAFLLERYKNTLFTEDELEIIGREIRLADIILCLEDLVMSISYRHYYKGGLQFEKGGKLLGVGSPINARGN